MSRANEYRVVPMGVTALVQQTESGHLAVEVRADSPLVAAQVWSRAAQLNH